MVSSSDIGFRETLTSTIKITLRRRGMRAR